MNSKLFYTFLFWTFISIVTTSTLYAEDSPRPPAAPLLEQKNQDLLKLDSEQEKLYQHLAETWAPIFFADSEIATRYSTEPNGQQIRYDFMNPADAIASPFFDGDEDWSNNSVHIKEVVKNNEGAPIAKYSLKSQVLFSVIETKSHYYIAYTKYNALDTSSHHGQDSEVVWTVIRKIEGNPQGLLEFVVTNAHGFPKIYSPYPNIEKRLRANLASQLAYKKELMTEALSLMDVYSKEHHLKGRPEFLKNEKGDVRGLKVFVCQKGHALYKCNTTAWKNGYGAGYIYVCVPRGQETEALCYPMRPQEERLVGYSLLSQDKLILDLYPNNESQLSSAERERLVARRSKLFEGSQDPSKKVYLTEGRLRLRQGLPTEIVRGPQDVQAEANLSHDWNAKTPYPLAFPHAIHHLLDPVNRSNISDQYIFNPYVEFEELYQPISASSDRGNKVFGNTNLMVQPPAPGVPAQYSPTEPTESERNAPPKKVTDKWR